MKPFSPREVTARIKVILRRVAPAAAPGTITVPAPAAEIVTNLVTISAPFTHDELRCRISYRGRPLDLTRKTLRAKLRAVAPDDIDPIVTHRGLGYSLRD